MHEHETTFCDDISLQWTNIFQCALVTDDLQSFVIFFLYADGEIQRTA